MKAVTVEMSLDVARAGRRSVRWGSGDTGNYTKGSEEEISHFQQEWVKWTITVTKLYQNMYSKDKLYSYFSPSKTCLTAGFIWRLHAWKISIYDEGQMYMYFFFQRTKIQQFTVIKAPCIANSGSLNSHPALKFFKYMRKTMQ